VCVRVARSVGAPGGDAVPVGAGEKEARARLRTADALAARAGLSVGRATVRVGERSAEGERCAVAEREPPAGLSVGKGSLEASKLPAEAVPGALGTGVRESEEEARGEKEAVVDVVLEGERAGDLDSVPQPHAAVKVGEDTAEAEGSEAVGAALAEGAPCVEVGGNVAEVEGLAVREGALTVGAALPVPPCRGSWAVGNGSREPARFAAVPVGAAEDAAGFEGAPPPLLLTRGDALEEPESSLDTEGEGEGLRERGGGEEGTAERVEEGEPLTSAERVAASATVPVGRRVGAPEGASGRVARAEDDSEGPRENRAEGEGEREALALREGSSVPFTVREGPAERVTMKEGPAEAVRGDDEGRALPVRAAAVPVARSPPKVASGPPSEGVLATEPERDAVAAPEGRALLVEDLEGEGEPLKEAHADAERHAEPLRAPEAVAPRLSDEDPVGVAEAERLGGPAVAVRLPVAAEVRVGKGVGEGRVEAVAERGGLTLPEAVPLAVGRALTEAEPVTLRERAAEAVMGDAVRRALPVPPALAVARSPPKVAAGPPSEGVLAGDGEGDALRLPGRVGDARGDGDEEALRLGEADTCPLREPEAVRVGEADLCALREPVVVEVGEGVRRTVPEVEAEGRSRAEVEGEREGGRVATTADALALREGEGEARATLAAGEAERAAVGREEVEGTTPVPARPRASVSAPGAAARGRGGGGGSPPRPRCPSAGIKGRVAPAGGPGAGSTPLAPKRSAKKRTCRSFGMLLGGGRVVAPPQTFRALRLRMV